MLEFNPMLVSSNKGTAKNPNFKTSGPKSEIGFSFSRTIHFPSGNSPSHTPYPGAANSTVKPEFSHVLPPPG